MRMCSSGRPAGRHHSIAVVSRAAGCVAAFTLWSASTLIADRPSPIQDAGRSFSEDQSLREYRCYRRMHAWTDGQGHEAWLEARTELKDGKFVYAIVSERGSDTIRGRVLHAVLESESATSSTRGTPTRPTCRPTTTSSATPAAIRMARSMFRSSLGGRTYSSSMAGWY